MSVKIARLRNGEDVISDVKEVIPSKETEDGTQPVPVAFQFSYPYTISVIDVTVDDGSEGIRKISEPELYFRPWAPLSSTSQIYVRLEEVVSLYDAHEAVLAKYNEIMEAHNGTDSEDSSTEERATE